MNKVCKEYIKEIKAIFPYKGKKERAYIKNLYNDIENFCEDANPTTKEEFYENYGKPNEVVNEYLSAVGTEYIVKKIRIANYIKALIVIIMAGFIVTSTIIAINSMREYEIFKQEQMVYADEVES